MPARDHNLINLVPPPRLEDGVWFPNVPIEHIQLRVGEQACSYECEACPEIWSGIVHHAGKGPPAEFPCMTCGKGNMILEQSPLFNKF